MSLEGTSPLPCALVVVCTSPLPCVPRVSVALQPLRRPSSTALSIHDFPLVSSPVSLHSRTRSSPLGLTHPRSISVRSLLTYFLGHSQSRPSCTGSGLVDPYKQNTEVDTILSEGIVNGRHVPATGTPYPLVGSETSVRGGTRGT